MKNSRLYLGWVALFCVVLLGLTWQQHALPDCQSGSGILVYTESSKSLTCATAVSLSGATSFVVPIGAGAAPTANGDIRFDSTRETYVVGVNGLTGSLSPTLEIATSTTDLLDAQVIGTTETVFATNFSVPANLLDTNIGVRLTFRGEYQSSGSPPSSTLRMRWGGLSGPVIYSSNTGAVSANRNNEGWSLSVMIINTGATSATAAVITQADSAVSAAGGLPPTNNRTDQPVTLNTTALTTIVLTVQFSAATNNNTWTVQQLVVEKL